MRIWQRNWNRNLLRKMRDTKEEKNFEDKLNEEVLERAKIIHISFVTMTLHPPTHLVTII